MPSRRYLSLVLAGASMVPAAAQVRQTLPQEQVSTAPEDGREPVITEQNTRIPSYFDARAGDWNIIAGPEKIAMSNPRLHTTATLSYSNGWHLEYGDRAGNLRHYDQGDKRPPSAEEMNHIQRAYKAVRLAAQTAESAMDQYQANHMPVDSSPELRRQIQEAIDNSKYSHSANYQQLQKLAGGNPPQAVPAAAPPAQQTAPLIPQTPQNVAPRNEPSPSSAAPAKSANISSLARGAVVEDPSNYAFVKISPSTDDFTFELGNSLATVHPKAGTVEFSTKNGSHKSSYEEASGKVLVDGKELPRGSQEAARIKEVATSLQTTVAGAEKYIRLIDEGFVQVPQGTPTDAAGKIAQMYDQDRKNSTPAAQTTTQPAAETPVPSPAQTPPGKVTATAQGAVFEKGDWKIQYEDQKIVATNAATGQQATFGFSDGAKGRQLTSIDVKGPGGATDSWDWEKGKLNPVRQKMRVELHDALGTIMEGTKAVQPVMDKQSGGKGWNPGQKYPSIEGLNATSVMPRGARAPGGPAP